MASEEGNTVSLPYWNGVYAMAQDDGPLACDSLSVRFLGAGIIGMNHHACQCYSSLGRIVGLFLLPGTSNRNGIQSCENNRDVVMTVGRGLGLKF